MPRKATAATAASADVQKLTRGGNRKIAFAEWVNHNPSALKFVDLWLRLRNLPFDHEDHSDWSASDVFKELRSTYGCPVSDHTSLTRWLRTYRGDQWQQ
jgi:hypothetical protein